MYNIQDIINNVAELLKPIVDKGSNLVYIGRLGPMHYGHQGTIGGMLKAAPNDHLLLLGSCNTPLAPRHMFKFTDRLDLVKTVFPDIKVAGLPDFPEDNDAWFESLDHTIALTGKDPKNTTFIGGCDADVQWFKDNNRKWVLVDRKVGITPDISGTEIREFLAKGNKEELAKYVDERIINKATETFKRRWREYNEFISR